MEEMECQTLKTLNKCQKSSRTSDTKFYMMITPCILQSAAQKNPFVAVATIGDDNKLAITCQVAKLGDLREDDIPSVQFFLLDANTLISPFAFGILTGSDNPELDEASEFPIILTDSLPLGHLCRNELASSMDSLLVALKASDEALRIGL